MSAMKLKFLILGLVFVGLSVSVCHAQDSEETLSSLWTQATDHLSYIWDEGRIEAVLPVHTWHNRWVYDHKKIKTYNENPWGFGLGKYVEPTEDRRYGIMAMTFQDSFNKPEPTIWYSWEALWRAGKDFRPSLGIVAGITFRDNYHWIPVPGAAPTLGFDYKSFSVQSLYVPGFDVLFTWLVWRF